MNETPSDVSGADLAALLASMTELKAIAASLAEKADTQQQVLDRLHAAQVATEETRRYSHVSRWIAIVAVVGIVLDISLTGWGAVLYERIRQNTADVRAVQERTSDQVWCPLYEVLAKALTGAPAPGATPTQLAIRQGLVDVVRTGSTALRCPPAPN